MPNKDFRYAITHLRGLDRRRIGFSIVELLVVVAIISILASVALPSFYFIQRRERVNAVALSLYGWLNEVRQAATRVEGEGCEIQFKTGPFSIGSTIAEVANQSCASLLANSSFVNDGASSQQRSIQLAASESDIIYTPRTLTTNTSDVILTFAVGGESPVRCLRISAISGAIEVGRNDASSSDQAVCTYNDTSRL